MTQASDPAVKPAAQALPLPQVTQDAVPYWEALKQEKLIFQRCTSCKSAMFPPRSDYCPYCNTYGQIEWEQSAGRGKVYSFSVIERPPTAAWNDRAPYNLGFVWLDEDWVIFSEIRGAPEDLAIDARVHVGYETRGDFVLPIFNLDR